MRAIPKIRTFGAIVVYATDVHRRERPMKIVYVDEMMAAAHTVLEHADRMEAHANRWRDVANRWASAIDVHA